MIVNTLRLINKVFPLFILITLLVSCEPKNDENLVPSYLHIDQIDLTTTYQQGTSSAKITDAWVYIDETLIGSFELPATIPILTKGKQKVTIRPGIKLNGIDNTRAIYPFFNAINRDIDLVKDSVIDLDNLVVNYNNNIRFPWLENFDLSGATLDTTSKSTVNFVKTSDPLLRFPEEGNSYSAMISMDNDSALFEAVTTQKYDFPSAGNSVFLEMNYKINHSLVVGVIYKASGLRVQRPLIVLNKTDDWKKVYVNLTVPKYDTPSAVDFQIFFGAQKEADTDDALLLIDNLKLVHFNTNK